MEFFVENNKVYWAKTRADALIPTKKAENAGYDFYAAFDEEYIIIEPFHVGLLPTGISWASSEDYYLQLEERSSTGVKGMKICGGIIDSGYRGEIKVALYNANTFPIVLSLLGEDEIRKKIPDREFMFYSTSKSIAQGIIHRVEKMEEQEISIEALRQIPSERGDKGFGSSNK